MRKPQQQRAHQPRWLRRIGLVATLLTILAFPSLSAVRDATPARATPTASGAEPLYPLNHTFDADVLALGTTANADFETAPYTVGTPPANSNLQSAPADAGTQLTNNDFETGTFSNWTTTGSPTIQTDHTNWARMTGADTVTSAAITIDSAAQALVFDVNWVTNPGYSWIRVSALSGPTFSTVTVIGDRSCISCGTWDKAYIDLSGYLGQTIKLKFVPYSGTVGFDNVKVQTVFPNYLAVGGFKPITEAGGNVYAYLPDSASKLTTAAFTVDSAAQNISMRVHKETASTTDYWIYVLSGATYSTATQVLIGYADPGWTTVKFDASAWIGQSIKVRVNAFSNPLGVDDLGVMNVAVPQWTVTADTRAETGGPTGNFVSTNGNLTSTSLTLAANVQQLSVKYRGDVTGSSFYLELLRGPTFSTVTDLGGNITSTLGVWKTVRVSVQPYAGETVKLRIRSFFNRMSFDDGGLFEQVVPGWTLNTTDPVQAGTDTYGTYMQPAKSQFFLRSSDFTPGLVDAAGTVEQRYYSVSYDIGTVTAGNIQVDFKNYTGGTWTVFTDASNTPTGFRTKYFYLADFMGTKGYFIVKIGDPGGKLYSIADNIPRQQLQEPNSQKVGYGVDTSTGAFGYTDSDIQLEGRMPINFRRFYSTQSDRLGTLGYRWSSSYETRMEFTPVGDGIVIFGSGGEETFKWNAGLSTFTNADARQHDALVKNGDGSFTFKTNTTYVYAVDAEGNPTGALEMGGAAAQTTFDASGRLDGINGGGKVTTLRSYNFTSAGRLSNIKDLNNNTITLGYDGSGRLSTITDPDSRALTLTYNGAGRLSSLAAPGGATVRYAYDANGDLTTVTDADSGVRTFAYNKHRLTQAVDQRGKVVFTNTLDTWNRVLTQTDALSNTITFAYDTPAKGVTSVTDPLSNVAKYYFDLPHRTTDKVDPLGRVLTYIYDSAGNVQKIIDPVNNQWQFAYDSSGGLVNLTDPLGNSAALVYNALHLPTTVTDARGNSTTMTYSATGDLLTSTDPLGKVTSFTYDAAGKMLTTTDPLGHTTTYTYDAAGNVASKTDALSHTWSWTYDSSGRMLTATNPLGQQKHWVYRLGGQLAWQFDELNNQRIYGYLSNGAVAFIQDELGHQTQWTYDDRGLPVVKTDPAGKLTIYLYDADRRITSVIDPNALETEYTYDSAGRILTVTDPTGAPWTYTYDARGNLATAKDALNRITLYTYDNKNRNTSVTLPNGGVRTKAYDANDNLTVDTDPLGHATTRTYDALNRVTVLGDALLHQTHYTYDDAGRLTQTTDPLSRATTSQYDAANRMTSTTDPLGHATTFTYDNANRRTGVTDPMGRTTTYALDAAGRRVGVTDPAGNATAYGYDAVGRPTTTTAPSGAITARTYDARGLLGSITDPLLRVTAFGYDNAGRRISVTDPRGNALARTYDDAGREKTVTDALSGVVTFNYDAAGQQTSVVNPNNKTTSFTYDSLGNVLTQTDPLNRTTTSVYDLAGRLTQTTDPRGTIRTFSYDAIDRLIGETYSGGGTITYGYDAASNRTSMVDASGTTSWAYDAADRTTSTTTAAGAVAYTYNNANQRSSMTLPGRRTATYTYDSAARLASLTDWQSRTTSFGYDVNSRRTSITRPNGVVSSYGYDAAGQTTSIVHALGGTPLQSFTYAYDNGGNRTSVTYGAGTESYVLDALNRLTSVTYPGGSTTTYSYDANGNRATKVTGGVTTTYTYDNAGQLTSDGTNSYAYDAAGNQTARGSDTFSWDYANRLSGATVGGTSATYTYDADGVRTRKVVSGTTTNFVWDRNAPPSSPCASGNCGCSATGACGCGAPSKVGLPLLIDDGTNGYLFAEGLLAQIDSSSNATYGLDDALASLREATDGTGAVIGTADYDVFGTARSGTGISSPFGFTGEERDAETGFTFLRARYLDPAAGRFNSVDTLQPNAAGTQGWNAYAYANGNPTRYSDPSGMAAAAAGAAARPNPYSTVELAVSLTVAAYATQQLVITGIKLAAIFEMLALAFDDVTRPLANLVSHATDGACAARAGVEHARCSKWGHDVGSAKAGACCHSIASQRFLNCVRHIPHQPELPMDDPESPCWAYV